MKNNALVLDLDDTLYSELEYLRSAYQFIAKRLLPESHNELYERLINLYFKGQNVFDVIISEYPEVNKVQLLEWYRYHQPDIRLYDGVLDTLQAVKDDYKFAIITDGRSQTQRNKIKALGLEQYVDEIVISEEIGSEKPSKKNYLAVENKLNCKTYIYIGDNLKKDFITPNQLGWMTICLLDKGQNVHKQDINMELAYQPQHYVRDWYEILELIK